MKTLLILILSAASALAVPPGFNQTDTLKYGLVGWWPINEGSGTTVYDSSGYGNTGNFTNSPVWTTGIIGGALDFSGAKALTYAVVNGFASSITTNTIATECFWFRADTVAGLRQDLGTIPAQTATLQFAPFDIQITSANLLQAGVGSVNTADDLINSGLTPVTGRWYHMAVVLNGSSGFAFYTNGVLVATAAYNITGGATIPASNIHWTSACTGQAGVHQFTGSLDDIRIYNRALSADEIQQLYNGGYGSQ